MKANSKLQITKEQQEQLKQSIGMLYLDFLKSEKVINDDDIKFMSQNRGCPLEKTIMCLAKDKKYSKKFKKYIKTVSKKNDEVM